MQFITLTRRSSRESGPGPQNLLFEIKVVKIKKGQQKVGVKCTVRQSVQWPFIFVTSLRFETVGTMRKCIAVHDVFRKGNSVLCCTAKRRTLHLMAIIIQHQRPPSSSSALVVRLIWFSFLCSCTRRRRR